MVYEIRNTVYNFEPNFGVKYVWCFSHSECEPGAICHGLEQTLVGALQTDPWLPTLQDPEPPAPPTPPPPPSPPQR